MRLFLKVLLILLGINLVVSFVLWSRTNVVYRLQKYVEVMISYSSKKTMFINCYLPKIQEHNKKVDRLQLIEILGYVYDNCEKHNLEPDLVLAIIDGESRFNVNAKGQDGEIGLMQILPITGDFLAICMGRADRVDLYNPEDNISVGCYYLARLKQYYTNDSDILSSYNAGGKLHLGREYAKVIQKLRSRYR